MFSCLAPAPVRAGRPIRCPPCKSNCCLFPLLIISDFLFSHPRGSHLPAGICSPGAGNPGTQPPQTQSSSGTWEDSDLSHDGLHLLRRERTWLVSHRSGVKGRPRGPTLAGDKSQVQAPLGSPEEVPVCVQPPAFSLVWRPRPPLRSCYSLLPRLSAWRRTSL